jgi:hypothetical protein
MKEIFGLLGAALLVTSALPYAHAFWRGAVRPHGFSWILWGLINAIVFAAQAQSGAGAGAWTAGVTALVNLLIGAMALRYGERNITRSDWAVFLSVLAALPLWAATQNPLWSVVLVSVIDTLAFWPTLRKSWHRPHEEAVLPFIMGGVGFACALAALENYSVTNYLYLLVVFVTNALFVTVLLLRRKSLA